MENTEQLQEEIKRLRGEVRKLTRTTEQLRTELIQPEPVPEPFKTFEIRGSIVELLRDMLSCEYRDTFILSVHDKEENLDEEWKFKRIDY